MANFIKKYWKYILCFILGAVIASLIPGSYSNKFFKKSFNYINNKEAEIQSLKDSNNQLNGQITILKRDKDLIASRIVELEKIKDSMDVEIKNQDANINNINSKFAEIKQINNYDDKQLRDYFSKYSTRKNSF